MRSLAILITFWTFAFTASADFVSIDDFDYPILNPFRASLSPLVDRLKPRNFKVTHLISVPDRTQLPGFGKNRGTPFAYSLQKEPAPLIFILPGLGGEASSRAPQRLGTIFQKEGYNVVLLTNPFTWNFIVGASPSGLPGFYPRDAEELYHQMITIDEYLRETTGIDPLGYGIVGYSLGGGMVPFLQQVDRREEYFRFRKAVSINPPMNFRENIRTIDAFHRESAQSLKNLRKGALLRELFSALTRLLTLRHQDYEYYESLNRLNVSDDIFKAAIGRAFHRSLTEVVYASQSVRQDGVLPAPAQQFRYDSRYKQAKAFDFEEYGKRLVIPSLKQQGFRGSTDDLFAQSDLRSLSSFIRRERSLYLIHNADDFLYSAKTDVPWIRKTYGDRWMIYPRGGHCGNFWHPVFQENLLNLFDREFRDTH